MPTALRSEEHSTAGGAPRTDACSPMTSCAARSLCVLQVHAKGARVPGQGQGQGQGQPRGSREPHQSSQGSRSRWAQRGWLHSLGRGSRGLGSRGIWERGEGRGRGSAGGEREEERERQKGRERELEQVPVGTPPSPVSSPSCAAVRAQPQPGNPRVRPSSSWPWLSFTVAQRRRDSAPAPRLNSLHYSPPPPALTRR